MTTDPTTTQTQEETMSKRYQVCYQLGGHGDCHTTIRAGRAALKRAVKAAKADGDEQAIWLESISPDPEYPNDVVRERIED